MTSAQLASTFDHTLLKADYRHDDIIRLCEEALQFGFASVCVLPGAVHEANSVLDGSSVKVCTVVGFPLGSTYGPVKAHECREAIARGASEIDMVLNIAALKNGQRADVELEVVEVVESAYALGATVKVIIETCLLTHDEKLIACEIVSKAQAAFIKTSTGFSTGGATVDDVKLLRSHVAPSVKVKASGGIRTLESALSMLEAGAERLGLSAGVNVMHEFLQRESAKGAPVL